MTLPPFNSDGVLPPGDHLITLQGLRTSQLVTGAGVASSDWDTAWRALLVDNLEVLVAHLVRVGIDTIFIDGSFVEDEDHPNDIDGYFVCDRAFLASGQLERDLSAINPIWTWDPSTLRPDPIHGEPKLPMWHARRVELFADYGQTTGVRDEFGQQLLFPALFRRSRRTRSGHRIPKGILQLI